jgi:hydroxyethylthiazole kinase-like uncharacterized protein yjeF
MFRLCGTDPMIVSKGLSYLTAEEMSEVDKAASAEFGVEARSLMDLAGLSVAGTSRAILGGSASGRRVAVLVGKGNNGGDGLVAARHLSNWGAEVSIELGCSRDEMRDLPRSQLRTAEMSGLAEVGPVSLKGFDLVVDALLGSGARGDPRGKTADAISAANGSRVPIISVDIPSGLDATSGRPWKPCITASATVTLGFPKTGFLLEGASKYLGQVFLADIGIPRAVYLRYSQDSLPFEQGSVVRIR